MMNAATYAQLCEREFDEVWFIMLRARTAHACAHARVCAEAPVCPIDRDVRR